MSADLQKFGFSPEQQNLIRLSVKLEEIFMPEAMRQREKLYAKRLQEGDEEFIRFAHYTSAEAALSIINNKAIWMRNTNCMSDFREVQHGFDLLSKFFHSHEKRQKFTAALDLCAPGAAQEAIIKFDQWWGDIRSITYVTSISEHDAEEDKHGRLSMWRAFGGSSARVAIIFKIPRYSLGALALNLLFSPVSYLTEEEVEKVLFEIIANIENNREFIKTVPRELISEMVFTTFTAAVTCLKHEGFKEEREWRAIYRPSYRASQLMGEAIETINGVPQRIYKLPLTGQPADLALSKLFDRLIIGPSQYWYPMFDAFKKALQEAGVADADKKIIPSLIPIRT